MNKLITLNSKFLGINLFFFSLILLTNITYSQLGEQVGVLWIGTVGINESIELINSRQKEYNIKHPVIIPRIYELEFNERERDDLLENPDAPAIASYPFIKERINGSGQRGILGGQTLGTSFTGAVLSETGAFPPDNMGTVGPTQYIISVNGRLKSFNKTTGVADGVLNVNQDVFFSSVMTPIGSGIVDNFTSDPRIRYDRKSQKWIFLIIDVPCQTSNCSSVAANRVMIGVSDGPTITNSSVITFFYFKQDVVTTVGDVGSFLDYPTLGVDDNALYIGGNMFLSSGSFGGTSAFVVRKSSIMGAGPIVVTAFRQIATATGAGPYTPQGVDNFDATSTDGYFIGTDNIAFSKLVLRRITNPGTTPTISANINLTVPNTTSPTKVPHQGNTGGTNGNLDALDDRLYAAVMRNGHLWTAHSFRVNTSGVASTSTGNRNGCRWYDVTNVGTTPTLNQSGTIFNNASSNPVWYSIPSIMVSGQGHVAVGMTSAGNNNRPNASTTGRWATDALGTMGTILNTTNSATNYNPSGDPGGSSGRRWGDYSYVALDPIDDMSMWMVHQFCDATNSYGSNITKLLAPPPATPSSAIPSTIQAGQTSVSVSITGTIVNGSGFYDPGTNLPGALPFNHINASANGGVTVNSITYIDPIHLSLDLNTTGASAGPITITITNPDGQFISSSTILTVLCPNKLYVDASRGTGSNTGLTWENAYLDLQTAISNICAPGEIWVAKGIYKPSTTGDRTKSFIIPNNVKIYGGFAGSELILTDRNYNLMHTLNETILSGDLSGNDGPDFLLRGDNSFRVVKLNAVTSMTFLDGCTIKGGNCDIDGDLSGGGLYLTSSNAAISNCIIDNNISNAKGGGVFNKNWSPTFTNCTFKSNKSVSGGAIYNIIDAGTTQNVDLKNCTFFTNQVTTNHGSIMFNTTINSLSNLNIAATNCSFSNNSAPSGAGIYNYSQTIANILDLILKNCALFGNGGSNSLLNEPAGLGIATISSSFGLFDNTVSGYNGMNNITTTSLPFVSTNDLHIPCVSPAINVGTNVNVPDKDLDNNSRPYSGTVVDIGAYEYQETSTWLGYTTDWGTPSNWTGKMVPDACTKVIVNSGVSFMPIVSGLGNICYNIVVNSGASVNVGSAAKLTVLH